MPRIEAITAREVLDSRGNPTVQAEVRAGGVVGIATVPSGTSVGRHEAHELRDGDAKRYRGKGVLKAVEHVKVEINGVLIGKDTASQSKIDRLMLELDGTVDKSRLGANAILAVSLACARAEAAAQGLPLYLYLQQLFPKREPRLPIPQMNLINGGKHASNNLSIQEYHVLPVGTISFSEALRMGVEIYHALAEVLAKEGFQVEVADEGGFAPKLDKSETVFTLLVRAIEEAGYVPGVDAFLGIDAAANEFFDAEQRGYNLDGAMISPQDLAYQYKLWRERYPLISFEDPFAEDEWEDWEKFTKAYGHAVQIVGDDLYGLNTTRMRKGIVKQAANAVLVKPNQVGTLTETLKAILLAQEAKHQVVISHRSGETEDSFIADLAVAVGAGQIKTGAPVRSERTAKYNRLLAIEDETEGKLAKVLQPYLSYNQPRFRQAAAVAVK
ncbi:phosphopyruvate hydratase [Patescibacteria group bacterium]|nr:phosphopyruvate hydratase [Patescibacteria group bacterium]